jgi:anthranilate phosphoribosyltransferase
MIAKYLKKVVSYQDLTEKEAYECMMDIISGKAADVHIAAFLSSLSTKGESIGEITGFVRAMRQVCIKVSPHLNHPLVDTCGTGGDRFKTFNVSTISAIIAASCGVTIAKHGNRAITSKCGGADILEALGVKIEVDAKDVEKCLEDIGIGFMFAPNFHPAMKYVMPVRQEMGIRTVFNILGPLSSPANADIHLMGVFDPKYVEIMAKVLQNLGVKRAMVVHGFDEEGNIAMDEISIIGKTMAAILDDGQIKLQELHPDDFGLELVDKQLIGSAETMRENLIITLDVLHGKRETQEQCARMDLCLANTGAILFLAGKAENLKDGVLMARNAIKRGLTTQKLEEFIRISNKT